MASANLTTNGGNVAVGSGALQNISSGSNVAVGYNALNLATSSINNTAVGAGAGASITTASGNTYVGLNVGQSATNGSNVAIGAGTFTAASNIATQETCLGQSACTKKTGGYNDIILGYQAGSATQATGHGNILIGTNTDTPAAGTNLWMVIGGDTADSGTNVFAGSSLADTTSNLSSCGTGPTIIAQASDIRGTFTTGTAATACTLTFATARSAAPTCIVTARSGTAPAYTTSTTALTLSTAAASATYDYFCTGS